MPQKDWEIGGMFIWLKDALGEQLAFAAIFYRWILAITFDVFILSAGFWILSMLIPPLSFLGNPTTIALLSITTFWIFTILATRKVSGSGFIIDTARGMYAVAQQGLLPPLSRRVNQHGAPLVLIIPQAIVFAILALMLGTWIAGFAHMTVVTVILQTLIIAALVAAPWYLYARHNKSRHKTIVLPALEHASELSGINKALARFSTRYHLRPAPEDYLPLSFRRKQVREYHEANAAYREAAEQGIDPNASNSDAGSEAAQAETVIEADEIEYTS